jgi:hypothetical protein
MGLIITKSEKLSDVIVEDIVAQQLFGLIRARMTLMQQ